MTYQRDPNLPWYVRDGNHPATKFFGLAFAFIMMPMLVVIAWINAVEFDPYSTSFFTKVYVEPTHEMPVEMRIAGGVFITIGLLLAGLAISGLAKARVSFREIGVVLWASICIAMLGGAFFVAANSAEERIKQEMMHETGTA